MRWQGADSASGWSWLSSWGASAPHPMQRRLPGALGQPRSKGPCREVKVRVLDCRAALNRFSLGHGTQRRSHGTSDTCTRISDAGKSACASTRRLCWRYSSKQPSLPWTLQCEGNSAISFGRKRTSSAKVFGVTGLTGSTLSQVLCSRRRKFQTGGHLEWDSSRWNGS